MNTPAPALSRGIWNKNPCNIRHSTAFIWKGELSMDYSGFCRFADPIDGLRAAVINFHNYQELDHRRTVADMIARQAPNTENNTLAYTRYVATRLLVSENDPIDFMGCWREFLRAVVSYENGQDPYSEETYTAAFIAAYTR